MKFDWGLLSCNSRATGREGRRLPASHDWRGARYEWEPDERIRSKAAFDAERLDTPLPMMPSLSQGLAANEFWAAWTRAEALSKLFDVPVLHWIRTQPFAVPVMTTAAPVLMEAGRKCWTYTGVWSGKNLIFTCAWTDSETSTSQTDCHENRTL